MNIQSTKLQNLAIQVPKGGFTPVGKLDQDLSQGVVDSVELNGDVAKRDKALARRDFAVDALQLGVFGAGLGLALSNFSPLGLATGLATSTYLAWNRTLRKSSGKVQIQLDGQTRTTRYYKHPESYQKTPAEVRAEMKVDGRLGERISAHNLTPSEVPGAPVKETLKAAKPVLRNLSKEKRLLADLGQKSRYGFEVLNPVDAHLAARFISAGRPVYVVGGESHDSVHSLDVNAANQRSTVRNAISGTYIDRTFDYQLKQIVNSEDLSDLPRGQGLPQGFLGVYKNARSTTLTVGSDDQNGFGAIQDDLSINSFEAKRFARVEGLDLGVKDRARVRTTSAVNVRDVLMMGGVLAGMLTGMSVSPGIPHAALIGGALGGIAGREIGWLAQDRMPRFGRSSY